MVTVAPFSELARGVHRIDLEAYDAVTVVLIETDGELTLFDAGLPEAVDDIVATIEAIGHDVGALRRIVISHSHADHIGSAPELRRRTGAEILMSREDAELVASGYASRPRVITPGFEESTAHWTTPDALANPEPIDWGFEVDELLVPGAPIPGLPGSEVIACPGHCLGQVAVSLDRDGGVLLAGDSSDNMGAITLPSTVEDLDVARRSMTELATREFETIVFGHGPAIVGAASTAFRVAAAGVDA